MLIFIFSNSKLKNILLLFLLLIGASSFSQPYIVNHNTIPWQRINAPKKIVVDDKITPNGYFRFQKGERLFCWHGDFFISNLSHFTKNDSISLMPIVSVSQNNIYYLQIDKASYLDIENDIIINKTKCNFEPLYFDTISDKYYVSYQFSTRKSLSFKVNQEKTIQKMKYLGLGNLDISSVSRGERKTVVDSIQGQIESLNGQLTNTYIDVDEFLITVYNNVKSITIKDCVIANINLISNAYDSLFLIDSVSVSESCLMDFRISNFHVAKINLETNGLSNNEILLKNCVIDNFNQSHIENKFNAESIGIESKLIIESTKIKFCYQLCLNRIEIVNCLFNSALMLYPSNDLLLSNNVFRGNVFIDNDNIKLKIKDCTFLKNLSFILGFINRVKHDDDSIPRKYLSDAFFTSHSNLLLTEKPDTYGLPLEIIERVNITYFGGAIDLRYYFEDDGSLYPICGDQNWQYFPLLNESYLLTDITNSNQSILIDKRLSDWLNYVENFPSYNQSLKNKAKERLLFNRELQKIVEFDFEGKWFMYAWYHILFYTVHLGYEGLPYWLITSSILIVLFSFIYILKYRNEILAYVLMEGAVNQEYNKKLIIIKNGSGNYQPIFNKIASFLKDYLRSLWFSTFIFLNPKLPLKYLNLKGGFFWILIFNWLIGCTMIALFIVYIAAKFEFVRYIL
ncbi:MAG: hypothetical protein JNL95_00415 [Chitinophagales bacterium]|nr:hypothetical protein [Chitinophagales bacterium]